MGEIYRFAFVQLSEANTGLLITGVLGLLGIIATVGYRYRTNSKKPKEQSEVTFDYVNKLFDEQRIERVGLRQEIQLLKDELAEVRKDNIAKGIRIQEMENQLDLEKNKYRALDRKFNRLNRAYETTQETLRQNGQQGI